MGGLTGRKGESSETLDSEASLTRARSERAAAETRVAEHQAKRASQLETDDIAAVDQIDMAIAAEKRAIAIIDQRIGVIERNIRREQNDRRDVQRAASLKVIGHRLAKRTAKGARLEELLGEMVAQINGIKHDEDTVRAAWPFNSVTPNYLNWRHDVVRDFLEALRDIGYEFLPAAVRQAIGYPGSPGFTEASSANPVPIPRGIAARLAHNGYRLLESLRKVEINPPEPPAASNDAEVAA
jgi:hypothetical protein